MRSQLGERFRILTLTGTVVCRSNTSVLVDFEGDGFLTVVTECEGICDCLVTVSLPTMDAVAVEEVKRCVCSFFDLDPKLRLIVKTCGSTPDATSKRSHYAEPYVAQAVESEWNHAHERFQAANLGPHPARGFVAQVRDHWDSEPEEALYSVPRRYDLSSMFAISVAYAILFSIMRALSAPLSSILLAGTFFAVVGAAQAILFDGKKPREASIVAGAVSGFICFIVFGIVEGMPPGNTLAGAICSLFWMPIAGYLAGTMIGGIWLIADYLRQWAETRGATGQESSALESLGEQPRGTGRDAPRMKAASEHDELRSSERLEGD